MRRWAATLLKLIWGTYLVLTSIYCLLAFLPYTYFALIKAPAYSWMPWFAHHHTTLYWPALLAAAAANGTEKKKIRTGVLLFGALALGGVYVTARPFMPTLQNNWAAFWWSLIALLPLIMTAAWGLLQHWPAANVEHRDISLLEYSSGILVAVAVALIYLAGAAVHNHVEKVPLHFGLDRLEIAGWSLLSHVLVAIIVISILNLVRLLTRHASRPTSLRLVLNGIAIALVIGTVLDHFLASALSFEGWAAHLYASLLAVAVTLFLGSLVSPFLAAGDPARPALAIRSPLDTSAICGRIIRAGDRHAHHYCWRGLERSTAKYLHHILLDRPERLRLHAAAASPEIFSRHYPGSSAAGLLQLQGPASYRYLLGRGHGFDG